MPHSLRKIRKKRGSRTHGWGRVGQHRRTGSKGRRNPGRHKALWSYVSKFEPDYFSKTGFTSPRSIGLRTKTINVGALEGLASKLHAQTTEEKGTIDLEALGYTKLLGSGRIKEPLIVKVASFSKSAEEKVKTAGGQILAENPNAGE